MNSLAILLLFITVSNVACEGNVTSSNVTVTLITHNITTITGNPTATTPNLTTTTPNLTTTTTTPNLTTTTTTPNLTTTTPNLTTTTPNLTTTTPNLTATTTNLTATTRVVTDDWNSSATTLNSTKTPVINGTYPFSEVDPAQVGVGLFIIALFIVCSVACLYTIDEFNRATFKWMNPEEIYHEQPIHPQPAQFHPNPIVVKREFSHRYPDNAPTYM